MQNAMGKKGVNCEAGIVEKRRSYSGKDNWYGVSYTLYSRYIRKRDFRVSLMMRAVNG